MKQRGPHVTVVIPFYQRRSGLLRDALCSISAQDYEGSVRVLVVDDSSPVDPRQELIAPAGPLTEITVLRQQNAGPAAARNRALDEVAADCVAVAFLDSDDTWLPSHLSNAMLAIGQGCDLYISNHFEPDSSVDSFTQSGVIHPEQHRPLELNRSVFFYQGDMVDQIIRQNIIETSTVVMKWSIHSASRFPGEFRYAFEDHVFWLRLASQSRLIGIGTKPEVQYGRGVSIWRSSSYDSKNAFSRILDELRFRKRALLPFLRSPAQLRSNSGKLRDLRREFVAAVLYRLRRRVPLDWKPILSIARLDPLCILLAPVQSGRIARDRRGAK
ncbi:MAG: glycosyltransferase family 2 protein [Pseudomonadota bacterium]|nr:glycosyltransferase family 2 protein [Pseudomonadota bacterium]